jgi:hypothetical protein
MSSSNPNGNMTGTYLGNPVLNLAAIFATLGTSSSGCVGGSTGCLRRPSGCSCGSGATGNCAIYCQLVPLNPKKNPGDRSEENANTLGDDYYLDGVDPGSDPIPDNTSTDGQRGAQRLLDFTAVSSQPPVIFVNGNARVGRNDMYGFAVNGRGTIVSNADVILSDNVMYKERLAPSGGCPANPNAAACRPATADMLGIVAKNDLWFGDPRFGTFYEGDAIMLAGRDFNFVFLDNDGNPRPPENFMTVNGTMLANRQIAIFRDFADNRSGTSDWNNVCDASSTHCQPVRYNPDISCGSPTTPGCWQFLRRDPATGLITVDGTKPAFKECVTSSCTSGRRISHFEMTVNYDNRLFTNPLLDPPAMPPGLGIIFANQWLNWQECPIPDPTGRCS